MQEVPQVSWHGMIRRGVLRPVSILSYAGAILAGVVMLAMIGHILFEIALRKFFSSSTYVLDEFVGYGVAAMTFLALAHALNTDTHIRVSIMRDAVEPGHLRLLETLSILLALATMCMVFHYLSKSTLQNFDRGTTSSTIARVPLWIPEGLVLVGLGLFLLALVGRLIETWLPEEK